MTTSKPQTVDRTKAWRRLRKLVGLPAGVERRAVLQAAGDMIEELRAELRERVEENLGGENRA